MTPQEQNSAIAEACGWRDCHWSLASNVDLPFPERCLCGIAPSSEVHSPLPNYTTDLNAMHEAEKVLKWEQRKQYHNTLVDVAGFSYCEADTTEETNLDWDCRLCHATASQRAEAFLRTLSKWKDS